MSEPIPAPETAEEKQVRRWLEGVKRYAGKKGYEISVNAKKFVKEITPKPEAPSIPVVESIKHAAFVDELQKLSGINSEIAGIFNPINHIGSIPAALAALATPTRTAKDQDDAEERGISNILIPGVSTYNLLKRIGAGTRQG